MNSRALISLGDDRIARLDRLAKERGRSRSALVREAVDKLIEEDARSDRRRALDRAFGLWRRHGCTEDGLAMQRRLRAEWDDE